MAARIYVCIIYCIKCIIFHTIIYLMYNLRYIIIIAMIRYVILLLTLYVHCTLFIFFINLKEEISLEKTNLKIV